GVTTVNCSASDTRGNTASGSFTVTVKDTTPPAITVPASVSAFATGPAGAVVSYSASALDIVDGAGAGSCAPASGSTLAPGTTTVNCSATDAHGNSASKSFGVTVTYNFTGFFQPINMAALNSVKAGSAIPVKFSLGGNMGMDVIAAGYPRVVNASC